MTALCLESSGFGDRLAHRRECALRDGPNLFQCRRGAVSQSDALHGRKARRTLRKSATTGSPSSQPAADDDECDDGFELL